MKGAVETFTPYLAVEAAAQRIIENVIDLARWKLILMIPRSEIMQTEEIQLPGKLRWAGSGKPMISVVSFP